MNLMEILAAICFFGVLFTIIFINIACHFNKDSEIYLPGLDIVVTFLSLFIKPLKHYTIRNIKAKHEKTSDNRK